MRSRSELDRRTTCVGDCEPPHQRAGISTSATARRRSGGGHIYDGSLVDAFRLVLVTDSARAVRVRVTASASSRITNWCGHRAILCIAAFHAYAANTERVLSLLRETRTVRVVRARLGAELSDTVRSSSIAFAGARARLRDALIPTADEPLLADASDRNAFRVAVCFVATAAIRVLAWCSRNTSTHKQNRKSSSPYSRPPSYLVALPTALRSNGPRISANNNVVATARITPARAPERRRGRSLSARARSCTSGLLQFVCADVCSRTKRTGLAIDIVIDCGAHGLIDRRASWRDVIVVRLRLG
jgi:hypothetical protein